MLVILISGSENGVLICVEVMVCRFDMFVLSISVLGQLLVIGLIISYIFITLQIH